MLFLKLLSRLPLSVLYVLASFLYVVVFYIVGYRKKVVLNNLRQSFPKKSDKEVRAIAKQFYKNLSQIIVEILKTYSISASEMKKRVQVKNPDVIYECFKVQKKPFLAVVGHICNWEWILHGCLLELGYPLDAVYKELSSKKFDKFMYELRSRFGGRPVEMKRFPREVIKNKDQIRGYALISDQSPKKQDIKLWLPFLNQETGFYEGPAAIAVKTEMPVVYVGMRRVKKGYYEVFFEKIVDPPYQQGQAPDIIKQYAEVLEKQIIDSPADWLWSHRRWKHQKP